MSVLLPTVVLLLFAAGGNHTFSSVSLVRVSEQKDKSGRYLPPYRKIEATFQLNRRPAASAAVTLIPMGVKLSPITAAIERVEKAEGCGRPAWNVTLKPLTRADLLEFKAQAGRAEEMPFDALVIYPATAARAVAITGLKLPAGVRAETIQAAADLDGDASADVLMSHYCARPAGADPGACDYAVTEYYEKIGGQWRRAGRTGPC